jgi:hypothetical protein
VIDLVHASACLLGRHVPDRPEHHAWCRLLHRSDRSVGLGLVDAERPSRFDQLRQAEIEDLGVAVTCDHHVVGLEIAVYDTGVMRLGEPFRHLGEVADEHRQRLSGLMDFCAERHAVDVLHRDEGRALAVADLVDVRDVGMIERRGRFCLADKALHPIRIRRDVGRQDLQRHFPIELCILGQVHGAHSAGTEQGGDPVVFERAVNHKGAWAQDGLGSDCRRSTVHTAERLKPRSGRNYSNAHGSS